jgi:hypothetical protein
MEEEQEDPRTGRKTIKVRGDSQERTRRKNGGRGKTSEKQLGVESEREGGESSAPERKREERGATTSRGEAGRRQTETGGRRRERGRGGDGGAAQKGRVIQDRDRLGLALVGISRVVREKTLRAVLFPGRDEATFANRAAALARELPPIGAYWTVERRTLDDGSIERYLALTDAGYAQAQAVLGPGAFDRRPVEKLKPSHIGHDLELADFHLSLVPKVRRAYQAKVRGTPTGTPAAVEEPILPSRWRWRHASVFHRLTVLAGRKDAYGRYTEKPRVVLVYEPDAILETDTYNCTRYFVEWDRGTEPIAGEKERRTILDKLKRTRAYFWDPVSLEAALGRHWATERSFYVAAFAGTRLRRPKLLFVTRSNVRAANIHQLAVRYFADLLPGDRLCEFLEVLTIEDARRKLRAVTGEAERSTPPREWPWVTELRTHAVRAAALRAAAEAERAAALEATARHYQAEAERLRREREEAAAAASAATGILGKLKGIIRGQ